MGCQCNNQKNEDKDKDLLLQEQENSDNKNNENEDNNNSNQNEKLNNTNKEKISLDDTESKNEKYSDYPKTMLELINKIRKDPVSYADIVENNINNIIELHSSREDAPKFVFKKKVKVALAKGEPAFREAAEILRNMDSLPPLELKDELSIPLPDTEDEIKDSSFLKEQVKTLRENTNIDLFFKDLIKIPEVSALLMVVDDSTKSPGKKRQAILNKNYKYIGINSKFIGKTFVAFFTFSKK